MLLQSLTPPPVCDFFGHFGPFLQDNISKVSRDIILKLGVLEELFLRIQKIPLQKFKSALIVM